MSIRPLDSMSPTETLEIENGLSLVPRLRLDLTVYPASPSVTKPVDEWKLKRTLIDFLKSSLSVPEEDLRIRRVKDLKNRKRDDPLALGTLFIRDLSFLAGTNDRDEKNDGEDAKKVSEEKFFDWRRRIVEKMDGIELNIEGLKFRLNVAVPASDDFEGMKKDCEEFYALRNREPRVSSKPSTLFTHKIVSTFGKIRNLNVAEDDHLGKDVDEDGADIISGLHCKIVVQFEKYRDFYNTLKVLCCRSLQKQGSRLWADYEVAWDRDGFFRNTPSQMQERRAMREMTPAHYGSEAPRRQQHIPCFSPDDMPRKRFKE